MEKKDASQKAIKRTEGSIAALTPFLDCEGRLTAFPAKRTKKLMALWYLAQKIDSGRNYTEGQINTLLDEWTAFHDPATLRRELYNKHLLDRTPDGKSYWKEAAIPELDAFLFQHLS